MIKKDIVLNGFRIPSDGTQMDVNKFYEIVDEKRAEGMNFVGIWAANFGVEISQETFIDWAKYLAEKEMYFFFRGGGDRAHCGFTPETAAKMKEIAGDYFVAYTLAELGSAYACKGSGYAYHGERRKWKDLQDAKDSYINVVKNFHEENTMGGILATTVNESTAMISYDCEAGCTYPTMEFWPGDEIGIPFTRGTASAYNCDKFGIYFAHEWYGGIRYDVLKEKRLKMGYDFCYLAGGNAFMLESGDVSGGSHSNERFGYDHPKTKHYRKVMADFAKFAREDFRPAGGPKVRVAFVRGNLDGYSFRHSGGSLWRAHTQPEYGYGPAEYSWRILENLQCKRRWGDVHNYGEIDLSGAPGYGQYDVIPANVGAEIFAKYDYLIFVGWNSMTQEIYDNLKTYVEGGGRLFMTAAHLNTSIKRDGKISLLNGGDVSDLFGCVLDTENLIRKDEGSKFKNSIVPELLYPALHFTHGDPYFAEGYINYANVELKSGVAAARLSNTFSDKDENAMPISMVENKCGDGYAILMTNIEYPYGAAVPMYQALVREIFTASHRTAPIKVYGNDSLRFSVYEGDKVYLLNTDFDNRITATIDYGDSKKSFTLEPCELKAVEKI